MQHFAPVSAFFGELLISLDAVVLMLFPSRIAGIAIVGGLLGFDCREIVWRVAFVLGLISSPAIGWLGAGRASGRHGRRAAAGGGRWRPSRRLWHAARQRCTSGHGVCGLARLSVLVATLVLSCLPRTGYRAPSAALVASRSSTIDETNEKGLSRRFVGVSHEHWRNEVKAWCCPMAAGSDIPPAIFKLAITPLSRPRPRVVLVAGLGWQC